MAPDTSYETARTAGGDAKAPPALSRLHFLSEAAFGGWLSGLLFAIVDLSLVPGRITIHTNSRNLAATFLAGLVLYPLSGMLAGAVIGLLPALGVGTRRRPSAGHVFALLSFVSLSILAAAYLFFRVSTPTGFSWQALAVSILLALAAGIAAAGRSRWKIRPQVFPVLGTLWCVTLLAAFYFSRPGAASLAGEAKPDKLVILITADTLRADALGAYGNPSAQSPHLGALAADGALFLSAQASSSWTLPSHASMLTGLAVPQHGANGRSLALRKSVTTIGDRLRANGFRTVAVTSSLFTSARFFKRGFDSFIDYMSSPWRWLAAPSLARKLYTFAPVLDFPIERSAPEIVDEGLRDLQRSESVFLWLHFYDPHTDYAPPARYRSADAIHPKGPFDGRGAPLREVNEGHRTPPSGSQISLLRTLYQGEVAFLDDQVGRLRNEIERAGLAGRTSIVFVADHGESFGEHGRFLHTTLFQEELHVPLIVWAPGRIRPGSRVDAVVRGIDVAPTLAELAGLRWSGSGDARSVLPLIEGSESGSRLARSDRDTVPTPDCPYERESSLLAWPWKLILRHGKGPTSLFNLERDPGETHDVAAAEPDVTHTLRATLLAGDEADDSARPASLDPEIVRRLRSLGYLH